MPPEIRISNGENPKNYNSFSGDIWSLGETVFQALTGHATFKTLGELNGYVNGFVEFPHMALKETKVSGSGIGFVRSLMSPIPSQRLSARQALNQPWMNFDGEAKLGTADGLSQAQSKLEQLTLEGSVESSQASGKWTRESVSSAASNQGRERKKTPTSMEPTVGLWDLSVDRTIRPSQYEAEANWIDTSRMADTQFRAAGAEDDNDPVDVDDEKTRDYLNEVLPPGGSKLAATVPRATSGNLRGADTKAPEAAGTSLLMHLRMEHTISKGESPADLGQACVEDEDTSKSALNKRSEILSIQDVSLTIRQPMPEPPPPGKSHQFGLRPRCTLCSMLLTMYSQLILTLSCVTVWM